MKNNRVKYDISKALSVIWATSRENMSSEVFNQVNSNQPAQLQKLARILKL